MLACGFCGQQPNIDEPANLLEQLDYDTNITVEIRVLYLVEDIIEQFLKE